MFGVLGISSCSEQIPSEWLEEIDGTWHGYKVDKQSGDSVRITRTYQYKNLGSAVHFDISGLTITADGDSLSNNNDWLSISDDRIVYEGGYYTLESLDQPVPSDKSWVFVSDPSESNQTSLGTQSNSYIFLLKSGKLTIESDSYIERLERAI